MSTSCLSGSRGCYFILLASTVFAAYALHAKPCLVANGEARADIVIAASPPRMARLAAEELQAHLLKMTGAQLPIVTEPGTNVSVHIYVGESEHAERRGATAYGLKYDAYRMVSGTNWLALVGCDDDFSMPEPWAHSRADRKRVIEDWDEITGEKWGNPFQLIHKSFHPELGVSEYDQRGSLNAVNDYLRGLGVRWYLPGEENTIVPERDSLELPQVDRVVTPDFPMRFLRFYNRFWVASRAETLWQLRLGLNPGLDVSGLSGTGHGTINVHSREETKKKYPEYYALWGERATSEGSSHGGKPCLSSPGLLEQNIKYARAVLDHYGEPWIAVMPADGYSFICQCDLCKGKDTPERGYRGRLSDYVWDYVNEVAKAVYETHPDRKVCCFAYGTYLKPPRKIDKLSPNVVVGICQWRSMFYDRDVRRQMIDLRKAWLDKMAPENKLMIYDYYLHARPNAYGWESIPAVFPRLIAEDLRWLKGKSYGEYIETYREHREGGWRTLASNHLNIYITARLYWDAEQDVEALLEEYYRLFYGPAQKEAKAFFEYCEANWHKMKSDVSVVHTMFDLLAVAREAAGDTVYGRRIDWMVEYTAPLKETVEKIGRGGGKTAIERTTVRRAVVLESAEPIAGKTSKDGRFFTGRMSKYMLQDCITGDEPSAGNGTILLLGWADDALYVTLRCYDRDMENLNVTSQQNDDPPMWYGDSVDILIETHQHAYYQIGINPAGAIADADREKGVDLEWNSGAEVTIRRYDNRWVADVRIPIVNAADEEVDVLQGVDADPVQGVIGSKPSSSLPWYFNVCRQRVREGEEKAYQAFAPTGEAGFHVRERFGELYVE